MKSALPEVGRIRGLRCVTAAFRAMLLLLVSTTVIAEQTIGTAVADLKRLVDEGDYEAASSLALRTEGSNADAAQSFEFQFMKGVALQQIASGENVPEERRAKAIAEATAAYGRAAQLRPESVATLNNLAALNASAGLNERARDQFERAVKLAVENADPKLEAYALNYANYLENRDGDAAIRQAVIAMKAPHSGAESRGFLANLYARYQPEALLPFARTLYDEGRTAQVRQLALARSGNVKLPTAARVDWLSLLALSLSRDALAQKAFDVGSVVGPLNGMAADDVRTMAMQLALVLTDPPTGSDGLDRWRYSSSVSKTIATSPRAAMRELLSALGERNVRLAAASSALSAQYYRLAIEFGERGPDPEAFLALVNIYADRNDAAGLNELMDRYEYELFTEKGEAYVRGDWPLIYRLHVALGMTYAHLGEWNDTRSPYQNAAFQLEAAQRAADELNRRLHSKKFALPPAAAKKLSGYYIMTGQTDRATKVQVNAAAVLQDQGRTDESAEILKSIDRKTISAADAETKAKYERLQRIVPAN